MAKHYGFPYMGSKDKIASWVLQNLPPGKRFVDLFGGGFAMSHAALLSGRYEQVYYNELNRLVVDLVRRAVAGEFNYERFRPVFITREMFEAEKEKDGYIKYVWSFGNSGHSYLFGKDVEPIKKIAHDFVVFGEKNDLIPLPVKGTIKQRRLMLRRWASYEASRLIKNGPALARRKRQIESKFELQRLQQLEQLERLQQLEQLERLQQLERLEQLQQLEQLERLQQLELICGSYTDYKNKDGDVVYCDPPYESTAGYDKKENGFDSQAFYNWVASRDYPVYFSSFKISDERFELVSAKRKRNLNNGARTLIYNFECIYKNNK